MTSTRSVDGRHWPELDGLRAVAILLVVARHSLRPFISEDRYAPVAAWGPLDFTPLLLNGWVGVDLFFVLSGFLIGRQALRGESWRRFWFKRVTRVVPAYWTCLALVAVLVTVSGTWPQSAGDFVAHLLMLQDYTGTAFVPAFWSLGAEEKFYLLAPVLALGVARLPTRSHQAAALAVLWLLPIVGRITLAQGLPMPLTYGAYFPAFRSPFHLTCESLVVGFTVAWASLALPINRVPRPVRELAFWLAAVGLCGALVGRPLLADIGWWTVVVAPALVGLACGLMVCAALAGPGSYTPALAWRGWQPLAVGAFTMYLTHMMVIPVAMAFGLDAAARSASLTQQWLRFLPWYLGLSVVSAWSLHVGVERPVLRWRDRRLAATTARVGVLVPHARSSETGRLAVRA